MRRRDNIRLDPRPLKKSHRLNVVEAVEEMGPVVGHTGVKRELRVDQRMAPGSRTAHTPRAGHTAAPTRAESAFNWAAATLRRIPGPRRRTRAARAKPLTMRPSTAPAAS